MTRTSSSPAAANGASALTVETPDGPFSLIGDEEGGVLASGWTSDIDALCARIHRSLRPEILGDGPLPAVAAVDAYYSGDLAAIARVPVRQHGTPLQQRGWAALRTIAPGAPLSYTKFSAALGHPQAVRAAASICARNAVALFVPCHRVLRSDGSLGGFAWGTAVKRSLLEREASSAAAPERRA